MVWEWVFQLLIGVFWIWIGAQRCGVRISKDCWNHAFHGGGECRQKMEFPNNRDHLQLTKDHENLTQHSEIWQWIQNLSILAQATGTLNTFSRLRSIHQNSNGEVYLNWF